MWPVARVHGRMPAGHRPHTRRGRRSTREEDAQAQWMWRVARVPGRWSATVHTHVAADPVSIAFGSRENEGEERA
ncbi:hypothetical protein SORBI_3001G475950 [Sorghum bicolor]|uniref:Uncharacterized protein n=1 Tax=Sorghum bicolor TaxID=4558 RepID=A0A1Z5SAY3_SORBI|nr:hypothetical protein SORBI_3001G475950 [Sorghum bicolor]